MKTIKFCDYIDTIKENGFEKYNTYLFIRFNEKDIHLVKDIQGKRVIAFEIGGNRWEEVEWDIKDDDKIYPISVFEMIKLIRTSLTN